MSELTLESLAARVAELERKLAEASATTPPKKDWRSGIGTMQDNEFTREMLASIEENSEAERRAALGAP
jgi:hypothetical protein